MRNVKTKRGIFPRVKEVYFRRLKEGNTKKKTLEKRKVTEGTKRGRIFISKDN